VAVTGSNGKSTTAAMIAAILRADGRRCWLGGNLGGSLLEQLDEIRPDDWVVLELSSFQLHYLAGRLDGPAVAVVTGFSPNHLDWHGSLAAYRRAKQQILAGQRPGDTAVLNPYDPELAAWKDLVRGKSVPPPLPGEMPPLRLPGRHNRVNAALAAGAATAAGCSAEAIQTALASFAGLPQRLEWVGVVAGRRFYNDSSSTTPESTLAALEALEEPIWLLAGGRNKGLAFEPLVQTIIRRCCGAAFFGQTARRLADRCQAADPGFACEAFESMEDAFGWCFERARPDEAILLSPGCASTDQFVNFQQRGQRFVELVRKRVSTAGR